jgi:hypothetical protein
VSNFLPELRLDRPANKLLTSTPERWYDHLEKEKKDLHDIITRYMSDFDVNNKNS